MTSQIPACKNCKHFQASPDEMFSTCALYHYETVDFLNGTAQKHNSLAFAMRDKEDFCGREGKKFEMKEFVEEEKDISFWEYFKRFFTYGGITNDFKEQIHKIKLEIESEIK
jgi:hypothetical protein